MNITKSILKWGTIAGIFLVPFIPFVVSGTMYFPFITGKGFAFRILIEIVFALYTLLALLAPEYRPKNSWITKAIIAFVGLIFVSDLLGANVLKSLWSNYERMEGFVLLAHLLMYYIVLGGVLTTSSWWNKFWDTTILASVIMSLYGLMQLAGKIAINQGGVRLDATFGNSAYLAIYLVFHIFLCLYMLSNMMRPLWQRTVYGVIAILEIIMLYYTATRGAILGLIGGLLLTAVLIAWKEKESVRMRKYAYGLLIGVIVVVGGFFLIRHAAFVQKSPVLSRFASLSFSEAKTQGRYFVWPMALKGVAEKPLFGWGQENFNFVFNKNYDPRMYGQEQWFDRTHDIVLDWMIAGGLIGFLAYASMYVALLYYVWRKESLMTVAEKSIVTGMLSAYVFHNLFVFDNIGSYIIFFAILAWVHTLATLRNSRESRFYTYTFSDLSINYIAVPVTVIVLALVVYFVNVPAIQASNTLIQAMTPQQQGGVETNLNLFKKAFNYNSFGNSEILEQLIQIAAQISTSSQVPDTLKQQFYEFTKTKIEEKIAQTPKDARYLVFAGSFFNRFGQYDIAIGYLTKALENSPRKQSILFELGSSYLGKGDKAKAFEVFKMSYDLEPSSPESQVIYAVGAIYVGNKAVLQEMLTKINPDLLISDNRLLRAYADTQNYEEVIAILTSRVEKDPTNTQFKLSLASAYLQIGQKQKAIAIIQAMIDSDPTFKTQGEAYIKQIQES